MKLLNKQFRFTYAVSFLIKFAFEKGYYLTFGDAYRDPRCDYGHPESNHRNRLAVDFNLFIDDGTQYQYITDSSHKAWAELHKEWERLGGAKAIESDMNHFSFEYNGIR